MAILKLGGNPNRSLLNMVGAAIAFLLILLLAAFMFALLYLEVPKENRDVLMVLAGVVAQQVGTVVNFFFGTSQTSKEQEQTISRLTHQNSPDPVVSVPPGQTVAVTSTTEVTGEGHEKVQPGQGPEGQDPSRPPNG